MAQIDATKPLGADAALFDKAPSESARRNSDVNLHTPGLIDAAGCGSRPSLSRRCSP